MSKIFKAYAPASAANLSVGFDLLGAALQYLVADDFAVRSRNRIAVQSHLYPAERMCFLIFVMIIVPLWVVDRLILD